MTTSYSRCPANGGMLKVQAVCSQVVNQTPENPVCVTYRMDVLMLYIAILMLDMVLPRSWRDDEHLRILEQ